MKKGRKKGEEGRKGRKEGRKKGREGGRKGGRKEGRKGGRKEGRTEGRKEGGEGRKENLYKRMQCSVSQFKIMQKPNVHFSPAYHASLGIQFFNKQQVY